MTDPVDPAEPERDENGLTAAERARWRMHYQGIGDLIERAIGEARDLAEARRRVGLIRLELRIAESAAELVFAPASAPAPTTQPPAPETDTHG